MVFDAGNVVASPVVQAANTVSAMANRKVSPATRRRARVADDVIVIECMISSATECDGDWIRGGKPRRATAANGTGGRLRRAYRAVRRRPRFENRIAVSGQ